MIMKTFKYIGLPSNPKAWGVGSLGNISGRYVSFRRYMRGNNISDMRNDWEAIGNDMRKVSKGLFR